LRGKRKGGLSFNRLSRGVPFSSIERGRKREGKTLSMIVKKEGEDGRERDPAFLLIGGKKRKRRAHQKKKKRKRVAIPLPVLTEGGGNRWGGG